jgi:hypothetical protein
MNGRHDAVVAAVMMNADARRIVWTLLSRVSGGHCRLKMNVHVNCFVCYRRTLLMIHLMIRTIGYDGRRIATYRDTSAATRPLMCLLLMIDDVECLSIDVKDDVGDVDETEVSWGGRDGANDKRADAFKAAVHDGIIMFLFLLL